MATSLPKTPKPNMQPPEPVDIVKAVEMALDLISRDLERVIRSRNPEREIPYCEDLFRYRVFSALSECGIDAARLTLEHPHPALPG